MVFCDVFYYFHAAFVSIYPSMKANSNVWICLFVHFFPLTGLFSLYIFDLKEPWNLNFLTPKCSIKFHASVYLKWSSLLSWICLSFWTRGLCVVCVCLFCDFCVLSTCSCIAWCLSFFVFMWSKWMFVLIDKCKSSSQQKKWMSEKWIKWNVQELQYVARIACTSKKKIVVRCITRVQRKANKSPITLRSPQKSFHWIRNK